MWWVAGAEVGRLKNGKGSKKSGSITKNKESYEEKEDPETLFSRMLKLAEENTEKSRMDAEELAARIIEFREATAALALDLVSNEDNPAYILGCFILSGVGAMNQQGSLLNCLITRNTTAKYRSSSHPTLGRMLFHISLPGLTR